MNEPGVRDNPADATTFTRDELEQFHNAGFVIVRQLAPAPLRERMHAATLRGLTDRIEPLEFEADLRYPGAPNSHGDAGGDTVRRLKQALSRDPAFTEWLVHPPLLNRLSQLLGPRVVCPLAHHNCIMTKEPRFSSETGWHQDIRYWSFARPELISVWIALGREHEENGCLQVVPGSHRMAYSRESFDEQLFFRRDYSPNLPVLERRQLAELAPGDVLFFHCKTLHAATRNTTSERKLSVVFTFRSGDNPPTPGSRSAASPELQLPVASGLECS